MTEYKVWLTIEHYDEDSDDDTYDVDLPECIGTFGTEEEARDFVATLTGSEDDFPEG